MLVISNYIVIRRNASFYICINFSGTNNDIADINTGKTNCRTFCNNSYIIASPKILIYKVWCLEVMIQFFAIWCNRNKGVNITTLY